MGVRREWRRALRGLAAALALLAISPGALAVDWSADREIQCRENRPGCRLLQMVMAGSFDGGEAEDAVTERVLASAYPRLLEVNEADIDHFAGEFGEDGEAARLRWYGALAECLRAAIAQDAQPTAERRVLALFLNPARTPEARAAREEIRGEMTEDILERIALDIGAPAAFARWVIDSDL